MRAVLIELDDDIAARLEQVAPGRSRRRSEFIRNAIRRALWELEEHATAAAYGQQPDASPPYLSADVWEAPATPPKARPKRR